MTDLRREPGQVDRIAHSTLRPAVFLDRDGTINAAIVHDGRPYPPNCVEELTLLPGAIEACERLKAAGFVLVVATNQPDVGRGTLAQASVEAIHAQLQNLVPVDRIEVCFHAGRGEACDCRKPKPGMLLRAAAALSLDLSRSWMVGDRWRDIDCGAAAGCRTVFIDWGYEETLRATPDFIVHSIAEAADIILAHA